jgi:hypothetical protein
MLTRTVPVGAAVLVTYLVARWTHVLPVRSGMFLGVPLYGVRFEEFLAMLVLPVLAWALWAPTARLAAWGGSALVLGIAGWGWWLHSHSADRLALYRAYPVVAGAVVVLATLVAHLWRRRLPPSAGGWLRAVLRIVAGCAVLAVVVSLRPIWMDFGGPLLPGSG